MGQTESEKLNEMMILAAVSRAICTVGELGVADLIAKGSPVGVNEIARKTGAHEQSLYRVMRFLASKGLFIEEELGRFDHTPLSDCLRSDAPDSYRPAARMFHRLFAAWDDLHHSVMTGEAGFVKAFGRPLFEHMATDAELPAIFDAGMTAIHGHETAAMLAAYDFSGIDVIADIGGGNGSLIGAVLAEYPTMKGILFDLEHVVSRAHANLANKKLDGRCSVSSGSFFDSIPVGGNAYLFRHIIHDWTDEQSLQILLNCRAVVPDDGRLLIVEYVVPEGNGKSFAKDADICMLVMPGGMERTESEYRELLYKSGFEMTAVVPTDSSVSVVEGRPV